MFKQKPNLSFFPISRSASISITEDFNHPFQQIALNARNTYSLGWNSYAKYSRAAWFPIAKSLYWRLLSNFKRETHFLRPNMINPKNNDFTNHLTILYFLTLFSEDSTMPSLKVALNSLRRRRFLGRLISAMDQQSTRLIFRPEGPFLTLSSLL